MVAGLRRVVIWIFSLVYVSLRFAVSYFFRRVFASAFTFSLPFPTSPSRLTVFYFFFSCFVALLRIFTRLSLWVERGQISTFFEAQLLLRRQFFPGEIISAMTLLTPHAETLLMRL